MIILSNKQGRIELPNDTKFSRGQSWETSTRFTRSSRYRSQTVTRRKRVQAATYSLTSELNFTNTGNVFQALRNIENMVGAVVSMELVSGSERRSYGDVVIVSVTNSISFDAQDGVYLASVTLNLGQAVDLSRCIRSTLSGVAEGV